MHAVVRVLVLAAILAGCGHKPPPKRTATGSANVQYGLATWYSNSLHGGPTASGERYDRRAMTAAHRKLRMNTRVRVTNRRNGRAVIVRINDRGPYGRAIIDLSEKAAEALDMKAAGVVPVMIEVLR